MHVGLEREGYYGVESGRLSRSKDHEFEYVMRKVINPVPLYAKAVTLGFPVNGEWIGFDFEEGDWVLPHGEGKTKDALFRYSTRNVDGGETEGRLEVKFSEGEGVAPISNAYLEYSELKMPHEAILDGYEPGMTRVSKSYHDKEFRDNVGCFFRSRVSKLDGKIVSSNYGKIMGNIRFDPRESGWHVSHRNKPKAFGSISFTYYFNPSPNDRNLEFAPGRNLFKDLDPTEQVREP